IADGGVPAPSTRAKGISPEIDAIVLKALEGEPEKRFTNALEMAEALAAAVTLPARTDVAAWVKKYARVRSTISTPPSAREMTPTTTDAGALVAAVRRSHASHMRTTSPRAMVIAFAA